MGRFIVAKESLIELGVVGLLSQGHILIEGLPGTAKTTVVKALARLSGCQFSRFQCAVDSQPADILGVRMYDPHTREFTLKKGPIFSNFLLIDEINRLSPKTQSAFIESMSERQTTIDGVTIPLDPPFIVFATQNPFEFEGTFPLIEAQKDRFMFSTNLVHLDADGELEVIRRATRGDLNWDLYIRDLAPALDQIGILSAIQTVSTIHIEESVMGYIRDIILSTRTHGAVRLGASSRASIAFVQGAKAVAAIHRRPFVIPDDVKWLAPRVLSHRLILEKEAELTGVTTNAVIEEILGRTEVP
ncbi:MAG: MoxR family ATPase [Methanomicrobiales archaeon]|jgi:MoxR-like ATPase|nr:MoxR family ATPase [Methanomicrobiales archaeon]